MLFSAMCRSDVSNDFEIDIEVYCFVSTDGFMNFQVKSMCLNTNYLPLSERFSNVCFSLRFRNGS